MDCSFKRFVQTTRFVLLLIRQMNVRFCTGAGGRLNITMTACQDSDSLHEDKTVSRRSLYQDGALNYDNIRQ